jgi:hypothetical protein
MNRAAGDSVSLPSSKSRVKEIFFAAATSVWLIFLVALGARLGFGWNQELKIPRDVLAPASFSQETGSIASALANGKGFSSPFGKETGPTAWLTPAYPLVVAGVFRVFGVQTRASFFGVFFLNALFSSAVCLAIFRAGKRIGGLGVGSAAAWMWAILPNAVMMPFEWIWDTSLTALLAATILWATLELGDSARWRDWCGYGLLWGFALMTNPALASLLPFLLGWATYRAKRETHAPITGQALAAAGIAFLCCVPWTVRNYLRFHQLVPLRSNFPLELYIGNNNNYATRQYVWPPKINKSVELLRYFKLGETAFMEEERRKALEFIRAHPKIFMQLNEVRFVTFWTGLPEPVDGFIHADSELVRVILVCNTLAALGGLAGILVMVLRRSPYAFPVAVYPIVFPVVYYVTHPNLRYRHPIDAVVLLLLAVAVRGMWRIRRGRLERANGSDEG